MKLIYTTTTNPIQYILPKHNNFGFRKQLIAMTQQFLSWRTYSTGKCEGFCEIIFVPMSKKMKNWLNYMVRQTSQVFKLTKIWVHTRDVFDHHWDIQEFLIFCQNHFYHNSLKPVATANEIFLQVWLLLFGCLARLKLFYLCAMSVTHLIFSFKKILNLTYFPKTHIHSVFYTENLFWWVKF